MPDIRKQLEGETTKLSSVQDKLKTDNDQHLIIDDYQEGGFYRVPIENIQPNPSQPRQYFNKEALDELAQSIKDKGVLQPIIIKREDDGNIFLVAGERRLRAAKIAELTEIPAIITKGDPAEIALIENLQRENLRPIEEARSLGRMMKDHDYTQEDLSKIVGKSRVNITETLSLNKLPDEVQKECLHVDIPKRVLIRIARKKTEKAMVNEFNRIRPAFEKEEEEKEPSKRQRSTPFELALNHLLNLRPRLQKIDLASIDEAEKEKLFQAANDLKEYLDDILK